MIEHQLGLSFGMQGSIYLRANQASPTKNFCFVFYVKW